MVFLHKSLIVITPRAMMRLLSNYDNSFDIGASVDLYKKFTLGAHYRTEEIATFYALFKVIDNASIGFPYDFTTSKINQINDNGSMEVLIKYLF